MVTIVTHTSLGSESVHTPDVFHVLPNLMLTSTIQVGTIFPALQKRKLRLREVVFQVVAEADRSFPRVISAMKKITLGSVSESNQGR